MIIKFDHLSYSCSFEEEKNVIGKFCDTGNYIIQFKELVQNIPVKTQVLKTASDSHGLTMLQPVDENGFQGFLPIEITSYPKVSGKSPYSFEDGVIRFETGNILETILFYQQLGFQKEDEDILSMNTMLDKHKIYIKLVESKRKYSHCLDVTGYSSLAWIINRTEKYVKKLRGEGMTVTDINELTVNGRKFKICFVLGKQGEIVELIGVD